MSSRSITLMERPAIVGDWWVRASLSAVNVEGDSVLVIMTHRKTFETVVRYFGSVEAAQIVIDRLHKMANVDITKDYNGKSGNSGSV